MKTALSSHSYARYIRPGEMTQLAVVKLAAEAGFEGIEFTELEPSREYAGMSLVEYARAIRAEAEKYGLEIVNYAFGANLYKDTEEEREAEIKRICDGIDIAAELGAKFFRHDICHSHFHNGRSLTYDQMLPVLSYCVRKITDYAATKGIKTCTENHGCLSQDSERLEKLYTAVDHPNFGILIDMGNFVFADEDCTKAVARLAPYAIHVHAKDFLIRPFGKNPGGWGTTRGCNYTRGTVVGEGDINVKQCIAILKKAGYEGYLAMEYEGFEDCPTGIARGLENIKSYLAEV